RRESAVAVTSGRLVAGMQRARTKIHSAHNTLNSAVLVPARGLPWLGRQVGAARALTDEAAGALDVSIPAARDAARILELPHDQGPQRVALLRQMADLA